MEDLSKEINAISAELSEIVTPFEKQLVAFKEKYGLSYIMVKSSGDCKIDIPLDIDELIKSIKGDCN